MSQDLHQLDKSLKARGEETVVGLVHGPLDEEDGGIGEPLLAQHGFRNADGRRRLQVALEPVVVQLHVCLGKPGRYGIHDCAE